MIEDLKAEIKTLEELSVNNAAEILELDKLNTESSAIIVTQNILIDTMKTKSISTKTKTSFISYDGEWLVQESSNNTKRNHFLNNDDIINVWKIIRSLTTKDSPTTSYREIVKNIIETNKLRVGLDAFNGGKNRNKYLFPLYYYPVKVLKHLGLIDYNRHGITTRLKFGNAKHYNKIRGL
jgi:hypothetical protein